MNELFRPIKSFLHDKKNNRVKNRVKVQGDIIELMEFLLK